MGGNVSRLNPYLAPQTVQISPHVSPLATAICALTMDGTVALHAAAQRLTYSALHIWQPQAERRDQHCKHCYCFVCDIPVSGCRRWRAHCTADHTDKHWHGIFVVPLVTMPLFTSTGTGSLCTPHPNPNPNPSPNPKHWHGIFVHTCARLFVCARALVCMLLCVRV